MNSYYVLCVHTSKNTTNLEISFFRIHRSLEKWVPTNPKWLLFKQDSDFEKPSKPLKLIFLKNQKSKEIWDKHYLLTFSTMLVVVIDLQYLLKASITTGPKGWRGV